LSPDTVTDVAGGDPVTVVAVCAVVPMNGVTVYLVRGLPPVLGAVQETAAEEACAVASTLVGAAGGPAGVTAFDEGEAGPGPKALLAVTLNVYVVPLARPGTVTLVAGGDPDTMVVVWAAVPTKGVTV
jgi:hypothetical protein